MSAGKLLFEFELSGKTSHLQQVNAAWKVSKYGVFSAAHFPAFGLNTERYSDWMLSPNAGKYGPGKTLYLDTFHTV